MKHTKRFLALLVAALILAVSAAPAMAASHYNALTTDATTVVHFTEKLMVSQSGTAFPNVTYVFKTKSDITGYSDGTVNYFCAADVTANASVLANGTVIGRAAYTTADGVGTKTVNRSFDISLNGLTFTEPGIYYWEIEKKAEGAAASTVTNNHDTLYLIARVNDVAGVLTPIYSVNTDLTTSSKRDEIQDNYPANNHSLTLTKMVTGNQGSKDEYFKFEVALSNLLPIAGHNLTVNTGDAPGTPATTLYGEPASYVNPTTITIDTNGNASATFWLKHNEDIVIEGILDTGKYSVTETAKNGYTTTYTINGGTSETSNTTGVKDIGTGANVIYTNSKSSSIPTGVLLNMAAPLAGIVLAGALLIVLLASRKRRHQF